MNPDDHLGALSATAAVFANSGITRPLRTVTFGSARGEAVAARARCVSESVSSRRAMIRREDTRDRCAREYIFFGAGANRGPGRNSRFVRLRTDD